MEDDSLIEEGATSVDVSKFSREEDEDEKEDEDDRVTFSDSD